MHWNLDAVTVGHNEKLHRFEEQVDGMTSLITYVRSPDSIIFNHTEVPPELEGNGIAAKLTQTALDFARANRLRVVPRCPYVSHYIRQHPVYQDFLAAADLQLLLSQK